MKKYWHDGSSAEHAMHNDAQFAALVLAADRGEQDPVAKHTEVACKAYVPVGGKAMVLRVLDTLQECHKIGSVLLCGPVETQLAKNKQLEQRIANKQIKWVAPLDSPARSAAYGCAQIDTHQKILLTTADHALLTTEIVDYFLRFSDDLDCDVTVAIIRYETLQNKYGDAKRTVIRLRDGNFCGCNLFTFNAHGRALIDFWQQAQALRKRPWKLINQVLGWQAVWLYLFGRLTLTQALQKISERTNIRICPVILPFPEAGIDVDKVEDWQLVESILAADTNALPSKPSALPPV
ncbi:hypothetical protein Nstercoris_00175 [Nitrosomonas stercoris]|uniref:MobA-like NTP transferase domain-containing protein n=1 Tax=Nitrosomonas stercoris TaxID=1444684 RepID=A0A4Y1YM95_9PROT|nr:hypothetical protein Nstercoris_00175 [Nitrosomonas stercoris]